MPNPLETRFCLEYKITKRQYNHLRRLVDLAASAQTREHGEDTPGLDKLTKTATDAVEAFAKKLGMESLRWDGLYPSFKKGEHDRVLPT